MDLRIFHVDENGFSWSERRKLRKSIRQVERGYTLGPFDSPSELLEGDCAHVDLDCPHLGFGWYTWRGRIKLFLRRLKHQWWEWRDEV